jgi:GT2 family glycosyltransferase
MKIDAIILSNTADLSHYGLTCRTINSLKQSDKIDEINIQVIESQNQSAFEENGFVYLNSTTIFPNQPFGYNKFLNIGIKHSTADWILICNNDLLFTEDWLIGAKKAIETHPHIKSFSPKCPNWHLHKSLPDESVIEGYTVPIEVCGWCILLHRSLIDNYELFDEQFDFWYQDNDYAMVLQSNNEKHALVTSSKVYHMVSASHDLIKDRHDEFTHGQRQKFIDKWNNR